MAKREKLCAIYERSFRDQLTAVLWNDFFNLLCNSIIIEKKPQGVPERWIKDLIFKRGQFAIFENSILEISGNNGKFLYGEPEKIYLRTPNNSATFEVDRGDVVWVGANQTRTGVLGFLDLQVKKLVEMEISLLQNIISSPSGDIIGVKDDNTLLSIKQAILQNEIGTPYIFTDKNLIDGENLQQTKLSVEFIADRLNQLKQEVTNETLLHYGVLNANSNKRERVQSAELAATQSYAYDNIFVLIDTANRDLEEGGHEMRLRFNGAMDDLSNEGGDDLRENEQGDEENDQS